MKEYILTNGVYQSYVNCNIYLGQRYPGEYWKDEINNVIYRDETPIDGIFIAQLTAEINLNDNFKIKESDMCKAINELCNKNLKNTKADAKRKKEEAKEKERIAKQESKEQERIAKQEAKEKERIAKQEAKRDAPNKAEEYISATYGKILSLEKYSQRVYIYEKYDAAELENIYKTIMDMFELPKKLTKELVKKVASNKTFIFQVELTDEEKNVNAENWQTSLTRNNNGLLEHTIRNYKYYLLFSDKFKDKLKKNLLDKNEYYFDTKENKWIYVNDTKLGHIYENIEQFFDHSYRKGSAESAFYLACDVNSYHPIKNYFNNIREQYSDIEGTEIAETFFIKYLGATDTKLNRNMTLKWLLAAVKLIEEEPIGEDDKPVGWDNMIILFGPQGIGKSKLVQRMFGAKYTQTNIDITNEKEYVDKLNKAWVGIFEELAKFSNKEMGEVKDFLTKTDNTVRLSYARRSEFYPRHTIFVGNTNKPYFLRDYDTDYERRFWVIECKGPAHNREWWNKNLPADTDIIDKMWAQVLRLYDSGKYSLDLDDEDIDELKIIQRKHKGVLDNEILIDDIRNVLDRKYTESRFQSFEEFVYQFTSDKGPDSGFTLNEIPVVWLTKKIGSKTPRKYYSTIMEEFGWEYHRRGQIYEDKEVWRRIQEEDDIPEGGDNTIDNEIFEQPSCEMPF